MRAANNDGKTLEALETYRHKRKDMKILIMKSKEKKWKQLIERV